MIRYGTIETVDIERRTGIIMDSNMQDIEFILPDGPQNFHPGMHVVFEIVFLKAGLRATDVSEGIYYSLV